MLVATLTKVITFQFLAVFIWTASDILQLDIDIF